MSISGEIVSESYCFCPALNDVAPREKWELTLNRAYFCAAVDFGPLEASNRHAAEGQDRNLQNIDDVEVKEKRIAFIAAHLLFPSLSSGGDILFAEIAKQVALQNPRWRIAIAAPSFARQTALQYAAEFVDIQASPAVSEKLAISRAYILPYWLSMSGRAVRPLESFSPDLVHSTGDFFPDVWAGANLRKRIGVHWTGVVHHVNEPPLTRKNPIAASTASYSMQMWSFRTMRKKADRISLLNTNTRDALLKRGFSKNQLRVVGAGIDLSLFPLIDVPATHGRVLWVHRLEPSKGIFDLPQILRLLPPWIRLDIVGSGPQALVGELKRRIGNDNRVTFHGFVSEDRLRELYSSANVFVSCSYEEGWGISICEALAMGIPTVTYELPSHKEIFGEVVHQVRLGDIAAFAAQVESKLRSLDTFDERLKRREAVQGYSFANVARRQAAIFSELLES